MEVRAHMLETSFQEFGFSVTPLLSLVILHGPFSWKRPIMLELPGWCGVFERQMDGIRKRSGTHASVQPNGQRSGVGAVARLEEPEPRNRDEGSD